MPDFPRAARTPLLLCLALACALPACRRAEPPAPPEVRPVRVVKLASQSLADTVSMTGTVQAQTEVNLAFRIDGRLVDRAVNVGDLVRAGQVVARLDPENEDASAQAARSGLAAARAQQVEARANFDRMRDLLAENAVSRAMFESSESMLKAADANFEAARARVVQADNRLSYTRLVADVAGVVTAVGPEAGEVVGAGRMVVQVAKDGGRDAVFDVPAAVKDRAPGARDLTVALTMQPTVSARARVREVSPRADPLTGTFRVRVALINPPDALRLGSTVTASMKTGSAAGYVIPQSALMRTNGEAAVWVVDPKTSTVTLRPLKVQEFDAQRVVVASGLQDGDMVVTAGVQALRPGQQVRAVGGPT